MERCIKNQIFYYICIGHAIVRLKEHIESVFATSLLENVEVFKTWGTTKTILTD